MIDEDLRLVDQASKRRRVNNPVPVPLVFAPVRWWRFGNPPPFAFALMGRVRGQLGFSDHQSPIRRGQRAVQRVGFIVGRDVGVSQRAQEDETELV